MEKEDKNKKRFQDISIMTFDTEDEERKKAMKLFDLEEEE